MAPYPSTRLSRFGVGMLLAAAVVFHSPRCLAQESTPMIADEELVGELPENLDGSEIRRGVPLRVGDGRSREQVAWENIVSKVEPSLQGDPARLDAYIANFYAQCVSDTRLFAVSIKAEWQEDRVVLTGHAEYSQIRDALDLYFKYLKFENVENQVELLPSAELGDKLFGLVVVPATKTHDRPDERSETMTQDFIGDVVYLLKKAENDFYLCHTSDGYVGHIAASAILPVTAEELAAYQSGPQAIFRRLHATEDLTIPAGATLPVRKTGSESVVVGLPDGRTVEVPAHLVSVRDAQPPAIIEDILATAHELLGTPYVWGGKSNTGIDCSGLVQAAFRSQGISLARDAYQQALAGRLVGTRWHMDQMRRGDLLYFLGGRGKISHTAIYLGDGKYIEASGPGVKITCLIPGDPLFEERRLRTFCFAKRILD
jgi:cell wall-associated NlpC family hydrolase